MRLSLATYPNRFASRFMMGSKLPKRLEFESTLCKWGIPEVHFSRVGVFVRLGDFALLLGLLECLAGRGRLCSCLYVGGLVCGRVVVWQRSMISTTIFRMLSLPFFLFIRVVLKMFGSICDEWFGRVWRFQNSSAYRMSWSVRFHDKHAWSNGSF